VRMSIYEKLEQDRIEAQRARLQAERRQTELLALMSDLAALRVQLAFIKLDLVLRRKSHPDQPRVPAGNPDGGQWTSEGSGQLTDGDDTVDVTGSTEERPSRRIDLTEEDARGGHTVSKHVGKSDDEMLAGAKARRYSLPGLSGHYYRHGSFRSLKRPTSLQLGP
jgi:hypothetical protein